MTTVDISWVRDELTSPDGALSRADALGSRRQLPDAGIYSWWFDALRSIVPGEGLVEIGGWQLLYVGISPGRPASKSKLSVRLSQHLSLNAEGSTLRLTLGVLLADELGLQLRRVGSGRRLTFHCGEGRISDWLDEHSRVKVVSLPDPWLHEPGLISGLILPLNLEHNDHEFGPTLSRLRADARTAARSMSANPTCCGA
jgi:hypothetical protein